MVGQTVGLATEPVTLETVFGHLDTVAAGPSALSDAG